MMKISTLVFDTLDSTNDEALKHARQGADEGLCIIARQQTAGRGRYGRTWVSAKDAGLYFSTILRPNLEAQFLPLVTLMSGVAVHEMLSNFGVSPDIKWVNDILVDERKICGILAETAETSRGLAVVVGIGINLRSGNFPPEIAASATSLEEAAGTVVTPADAAGTLARHLSYFYQILTSEGGTTVILGEWAKRSTYFTGKAVRTTVGNEMLTGLTDGLEPNGALRLRTPDGNVAIIQAGEIERLRADNIQ